MLRLDGWDWVQLFLMAYIAALFVGQLALARLRAGAKADSSPRFADAPPVAAETRGLRGAA